MTGSIGVQASQLEFTDFIEHYNVSYRRLVAGKHKDAGSVFRPLTTEEEQLYRTLLDDLHTEFIRGVADNRNLPEERVRELATGFPKLGREALELGLVDELGGKEDALDYFEETLNITAEPVTYKKRGTFLESLSEVKTDIFYWLGQGIGTTVSAHPTASFT